MAGPFMFSGERTFVKTLLRIVFRVEKTENEPILEWIVGMDLFVAEPYLYGRCY